MCLYRTSYFVWNTGQVERKRVKEWESLMKYLNKGLFNERDSRNVVLDETLWGITVYYTNKNEKE